MPQLKNIEGGCWRGYERVPGTIEFSKGSCRKSSRLGAGRDVGSVALSARKRVKGKRLSTAIVKRSRSLARSARKRVKGKRLSIAIVKRSRSLARSARKRVKGKRLSPVQKLINLAKFETLDMDKPMTYENLKEYENIKYRNELRSRAFASIVLFMVKKLYYIYHFGFGATFGGDLRQLKQLRQSTHNLLVLLSQTAGTMTLETFKKTLQSLNRLMDKFSKVRLSNDSQVKKVIKKMKNLIGSAMNKTAAALEKNYFKNLEGHSLQGKRGLALRLLGLSRNATHSEITKAYRKMSKIHHPDRGGTDGNMVILSDAYEFLTRTTKNSTKN